MKKLLNLAMEIAEQMLRSGAEVHRAEESVERMCKAFGAERTDVFIITSSMMATVYTKDGDIYTQTRRINSIDNDFEKLHRLNALSRKICEQHLSEDEIRKEFQQAIDCKMYPFYVLVLCYGVIAAAFTLFFGGSVKDTIVSFLAGVIVSFVIYFSGKASFNKVFSKFISSAMATLLAFLAVESGLAASVDKIIIGNIMTLIPGIGLTNALRDLFVGDSIAGILRSVEAIITALAIAAGYFLVVALGGFAL